MQWVSCDLFHGFEDTVHPKPPNLGCAVTLSQHFPPTFGSCFADEMMTATTENPKTYFLGVDGEIVGFCDIISVFIDRHIDLGLGLYNDLSYDSWTSKARSYPFVDICFNKGFVWVSAMSDSSQRPCYVHENWLCRLSWAVFHMDYGFYRLKMVLTLQSCK